MNGALADLKSAITAKDKGAFKQKFAAAVSACNGCHKTSKFEFIVYKPGKLGTSVAP